MAGISAHTNVSRLKATWWHESESFEMPKKWEDANGTALQGANSGWVLSHNAIRLDLDDSREVLKRMVASTECAEWEYEGLGTWWQRVAANITLHHDHEERFFFPKLREKVQLPERLSSDHTELMRLMGLVTQSLMAAVPAHSPDGATLEETAQLLSDLDQIMRPHLEEEEVDTLPLMTSNFTVEEINPVTNNMIKEFEWLELPHLYRQFQAAGDAGYSPSSMAKAKAHATNILGMPGFVFDLIQSSNFKKYDRTYGWLITQLKAPSKKPELDELRRKAKSVSCTMS